MMGEERQPDVCVACALRADDDMMTTCDECDRALCGHCAHSLSGEDVVCPACYRAATEGKIRLVDAPLQYPDPLVW
jgi:hypothetical protein